MNQSLFVNPANCRRCGGKCCRSFCIWYRKNDDPDLLSEVERFRMLDTDKIKVEKIGDHFKVEFMYPCKHLTLDGRCDIYWSEGDGGEDERPLLCRRYPHSADDYGCPYINIKEDVFK